LSTITRFGVSFETNLLEKFDQLIKEKGYHNRSEAIRDIVRDKLIEEIKHHEDQEVVGTLTLVFNHHVREVEDKLTSIEHNYHQAIISSLHVHLDKDYCLEVVVMRGKSKLVQQIADYLISLRGIKHGKLIVTGSSEI
jgi:CopG family nickel-responsive transcriptional regulator